MSAVAYQGWVDGNGLLQMQAMKNALFIENLKVEIKPLKIILLFISPCTNNLSNANDKTSLFSGVECSPTRRSGSSKPLTCFVITVIGKPQ